MKFLPWLDLFWIPVALIVVHPEQRIKAVIFIACCVFMLRLQVQMMQEIGFEGGFLHWWDWPILYRGMAGYGIGIIFYLITAWFSPKSDPFVMIAASITVFIASFCVTCALMLL